MAPGPVGDRVTRQTEVVLHGDFRRDDTCAGLAPNSSARPAAAIEHPHQLHPGSRLQHQKLTRSS